MQPVRGTRAPHGAVDAGRAALAAVVIVLGLAGCATPPLAPAAPIDGSTPAEAPKPATPAAPPQKCEPEPFCASECKRQGYPQMYCNLRCGC